MILDKLFCLFGFHDWDAKHYESSNSCKMIQVCTRCKREKYLEERHEWGAKDYKTARSCDMIQVCVRCKQYKNLGKSHHWGPAQQERIARNPSAYITINDISLYSQEELDEEVWKGWETVEIRFCERCGEKDERRV